jgi:hypothetical protein
MKELREVEELDRGWPMPMGFWMHQSERVMSEEPCLGFVFDYFSFASFLSLLLRHGELYLFFLFQLGLLTFLPHPHQHVSETRWCAVHFVPDSRTQDRDLS